MKRIFIKIYRTIGFLFFYVKEVVIANMRIAYEIITPTHTMKPGVLAIPLDLKSDLEILLINNLITMTPGTLSLDVSTDKKVIYIHAMYIDDADEIRRQIKAGLEKKIMEVTR
jgi:multicomponent Na+:H+ antiporter subunit E